MFPRQCLHYGLNCFVDPVDRRSRIAGFAGIPAGIPSPKAVTVTGKLMLSRRSIRKTRAFAQNRSTKLGKTYVFAHMRAKPKENQWCCSKRLQNQGETLSLYKKLAQPKRNLHCCTKSLQNQRNTNVWAQKACNSACKSKACKHKACTAKITNTKLTQHNKACNGDSLVIIISTARVSSIAIDVIRFTIMSIIL